MEVEASADGGAGWAVRTEEGVEGASQVAVLQAYGRTSGVIPSSMVSILRLVKRACMSRACLSLSFPTTSGRRPCSAICST